MGSGNGRNIFVHQDILDRINRVFDLDRDSIIGRVSRLTPNEKARILMEQRLEQLEAEVQVKNLLGSPRSFVPPVNTLAQELSRAPAKIKKGKKSADSGLTMEG
ncbi:hypothetical protein HYV43_01895 [Candidatus Micrarchaeota archaeon]|nr:hypothetical protein [Candidatus Micrarchaeota archaeon]